MPDPRRLYRRIAQSALPARLIAHLSVVALVVAASFAGVTAAASSGAADTDGGFLDLVSSVRGAGEQAPPDAGSSFGTLPLNEALFVNRGSAIVPQAAPPMPTPVALDPDATPLAAPGVGATGVPLLAPTSSGTALVPSAGGLVWPVPGGVISQGFHGGHLAIDIANDYGVEVLAAQSGVVVSAGWRTNGGGYVIEIDHGNGVRTLYNHLGSLWVTAGQTVFAGQGIAGVGCTGLCTGPHVHFQVIVNGVIDNPLRHL